MPNRLQDSLSSYLRQHAQQSVDWFEWGDDAFAAARQRNVPVFVSVGYASCHWCHVMSHESFDNAETAKYLNDHFVAVKVDREQTPDVDAALMLATQALNGGSGGWPMTVFLTPEGEPFFAGTYFPDVARDGQPAFRQVLEAISATWSQRPQEVAESAAQVVAALRGAREPAPQTDKPDLNQAIDRIEADFDLIHAGFGTAPKFPNATLLDALLVKGDPRTLSLAQRSLEAMARGGICDQVGGGFHRYAVDPGWVVPHFEKMLYDNALLLRSYVLGWRRTADHDAGLRALFERTAYDTAEFLLRELRTEDGAFIAGLDADSCDIRGAVHEGIFYLWNPELLTDALGQELGEWAAEVFHVTSGGTFEAGLSTLQLRGRPDWVKLDEVCTKLRAERDNRFRPADDELVVSAWNGLAISALVTGAMIFNEPSWLDAATQAARYLRDVHLTEGELRRSSFEGAADATAGSAEDYGTVATAFAQLAGATGDPGWLAHAVVLCESAIERFDRPDGGFYDAVDQPLYLRPSSSTDHATPSGTASLIEALRLVAVVADRPDFAERATQAAASTWEVISDSPRFAGAALQDAFIEDEARRGLGRASVVVISDDPFDELARAAWRLAPAGSGIVCARPGTVGFGDLLSGREERGVYVCRNSVCFDPVTDYNELKTPLWRRA